MQQSTSSRCLSAALTTAVLLSAAQLAQADADGEREALARLIHELEAAARLIDAAEAQANPDARILFRYDWLRQDLEWVREGIQAHLDAPRVEPRMVPPLRGGDRR